MIKKHNLKIFYIFLLIIYILISGCSTSKIAKVKLNSKEQNIADSIRLPYDKLKELKYRKLYTFSEKELDIYLKYLSRYEPNLQRRIKHLGLKNIDQPYELYLLGEFPFGIYDSQPLYSLDKSDCVVFVEHIYAMALSHDWNSFFINLQKIRYKNGDISLTTRNHYAIMDWNKNNSWLVTDITDSLGIGLTDSNKTVYNKKRFFTKWDLRIDIPKDSIVWNYIPAEKIYSIKELLETGDIVQIVRGNEKENGKWVGHFGMIIRSEKGGIYLLHSTPPKVKIQTLMSYVNSGIQSRESKRREGKAQFFGLRFLRLNDKIVL
ncbi:MAG: DUF1460 domain-containing protein [Candidatus Marinimicrobia bacterium]|nr:DUF1460 domain-containing protein [Candidatus Neomarinimicrobiota bacterium]